MYVAWENKLSDVVPRVAAYFKVKTTLILNTNEDNVVSSCQIEMFYYIKINNDQYFLDVKIL